MTRIWGIRHIRYYYLSRQFWAWWFTKGRDSFDSPKPALEYLDRVLKGKE